MPSTLTPTDIIIVIVALLISMTVHEFMHAFIGYKLGDTTADEQGRLSLNPLKHIDPVMTVLLPIITIVLFHVPFLAAKPVPFNPNRVKFGEYGAALLALAGPLSNLLLAILATLTLQFFNFGQLFSSALITLIELNVILFVFNMIPIPPLDGSRVLYAFAPESVQEFMQKIEPYGFFIIIALVLLGGFSNLLGNVYNYILNLLSYI